MSDLIQKLRETNRILNQSPNDILLRLLSLSKEIVERNIRLVLVRGIPGSGKSTHAAQICAALKLREKLSQVFEADSFMEGRFDVKKLSDCHRKCQDAVNSFISKPETVAIVSNTNTQLAEMEFYRLIAVNRGINENQILICEPLTPWRYDVNECFQRNLHNVPKNIIQKMLSNIKSYPTDQNLLVQMRGMKL